MISERKLVSSHSSFWRNLMPMADAFTRNMNSTLTRALPPLESSFKGVRNSLISELSFRLYTYHCNEDFSLEKLLGDKDRLTILKDDVHRYIARLEKSETELTGFSEEEVVASALLTLRLRKCMNYINPGKNVVTKPIFIGCGIVDNCEGDILTGSTLYELKNVERDFRLADIRQLLAYCALNHESRQYLIDSVGLVNARSGLTYRIELDKLSYLTAGVSSSELFSDITRYITADTPSR